MQSTVENTTHLSAGGVLVPEDVNVENQKPADADKGDENAEDLDGVVVLLEIDRS